jgi:hypothetical protein
MGRLFFFNLQANKQLDMMHHLASHGLFVYILVSIILPVSQPIQGDIKSTNPDDNISTSVSDKELRYEPNRISQDEKLKFEGNPSFRNRESEPKSELQELLNHEKDSHVHFSGEILVNDDASIEHPVLQDIDGFEIDITIDFE